MKHEKVNVLGMELERWTNKSCTAEVAEGDDWATIYLVQSKEEGKGHCTELLTYLKEYYKDKKFGCDVALNERMASILKRLKIEEYK